jgi:aspartyl-tRNA(Asn)/glutamyl-tRNA(Gln) amidotransferase subunit C
MAAPDLDVRYVAQLARLNLSDDEVSTFQAQLGKVIEFVQQLSKVDVESIEPTAHANPIFNVFREDIERPSLPLRDALSNAPRKANDLIVVTKVVE